MYTNVNSLGLTMEDLLSEPRWLDTGAHQLVVPLKTADAVRRARPDAARLDEWEVSKAGRRMAYLFAFDGRHEDGTECVVARYFFVTPGGGVIEDPGTGSACANLGGWCIETGRALPLRARVGQGDAIGRPCVLGLDIATDREVRVSGRVLELGQGTISLP